MVAFDLDDTLYLERDYVRSGFDAVAKAAGANATERARLFERLWVGFLSGTRGSAFDDLLQAEPKLARAWTVEQFVTLYREHSPDIRFLPGIQELLDALVAAGIQIGVITDGPAVAQWRKAEALRLSKQTDVIVLTDVLPGSPSKPRHDGFRVVMERFGAAGGDCIYVGDNPQKDFRGPRELGWQTIRLRLPMQLHEARMPGSPEDAPNQEVHSVDELASKLKSATGRREG